MNPRQRNTLKSLKYDGYVIMHGGIEENGQVKISRITESYPDNTHDQLALALGKKAVIRTPSIDSLIKPTATVYVVFYSNTIEGNIALTFAQRMGSSDELHPGEKYYLDIINY